MGRPVAIALTALAVALLAAACGNEKNRTTAPETVVGSLPAETGAPSEGGTGDPAAGKEIFTTVAQPSCTVCHTLADAGATGTVGPNLDETKPSFDLVVDRVTNGSGAMPAFSGSLSEQQIADVAAYVVQATSG
jgi:mono/diheme cytochrome c family protein